MKLAGGKFGSFVSEDSTMSNRMVVTDTCAVVTARPDENANVHTPGGPRVKEKSVKLASPRSLVVWAAGCKAE